MAEIVMPRLSDTMEEGTILRWLKGDGEPIARGEELIEIETDKATMTYESDQAGVLEILAPEGSTLPVGEVIARVAAVGAAPEPVPAASAGGSVLDRGPAPVGPAREDAGEGPSPADDNAAAGSLPVAADNGAGTGGGERVKASPLARRIAREGGIDLGAVRGSGPGGRIVRADLPAPSSEQAEGLAGVATAKGQTREVELSRAQQTVARRMAESKATIPDFTLLMDVDMEDCVALRAQLKEISGPTGAGGVPTYNDMVVKAAALALREHPTANGSYRDGRMRLHDRVNVGVAVAGENALVVPTVFDADEKSLGEIAREARTLAERVRSSAITPPELGGGTFTVSNLGMYGVRSFTAIINPPQAAILSVGAVEQRAVVRDGEIVPRHTMTLTLISDHRILYGAEAATFLARIRELLEQPSALTL